MTGRPYSRSRPADSSFRSRRSSRSRRLTSRSLHPPFSLNRSGTRIRDERSANSAQRHRQLPGHSRSGELLPAALRGTLSTTSAPSTGSASTDFGTRTTRTPWATTRARRESSVPAYIMSTRSPGCSSPTVAASAICTGAETGTGGRARPVRTPSLPADAGGRSGRGRWGFRCAARRMPPRPGRRGPPSPPWRPPRRRVRRPRCAASPAGAAEAGASPRPPARTGTELGNCAPGEDAHAHRPSLGVAAAFGLEGSAHHAHRLPSEVQLSEATVHELSENR